MVLQHQPDGCWSVWADGVCVLRDESFGVADAVAESLRGQGDPTNEAAEVADAIHPTRQRPGLAVIATLLWVVLAGLVCASPQPQPTRASLCANTYDAVFCRAQEG